VESVAVLQRVPTRSERSERVQGAAEVRNDADAGRWRLVLRGQYFHRDRRERNTALDRFGFLSAKKQRDFAKFKQIARLIQEGRHLSREGIDEILAIRRDMNDGGAMRRKYSDDSILELFEVRESSETARQAPGILLADDTVRAA
jgi:hypothetical protein